MDLVNLAIPLLCGITGGHAAAAMFRDLKLASTSVMVAGAAGGLVGNHALVFALGAGADVSGLIQTVAGGGSGGAIAVIAASFLRQALKG